MPPFRELAAQLNVVTRLREEQAAHLRAHMRDLRSAISEAGRQRRVLPWETEPTHGGLSGAHEVMRRLEQAEQLVKALEEWLREAHEAHASLNHSLALCRPPPSPMMVAVRGLPKVAWRDSTQASTHPALAPTPSSHPAQRMLHFY